MNEKINKLAVFSGMPNEDLIKNSFYMEKFAELIVRECVKLCEECIDDGCIEAETPMLMIKQHFGVE